MGDIKDEITTSVKTAVTEDVKAQIQGEDSPYMEARQCPATSTYTGMCKLAGRDAYEYALEKLEEILAAEAAGTNRSFKPGFQCSDEEFKAGMIIDGKYLLLDVGIPGTLYYVLEKDEIYYASIYTFCSMRGLEAYSQAAEEAKVMVEIAEGELAIMKVMFPQLLAGDAIHCFGQGYFFYKDHKKEIDYIITKLIPYMFKLLAMLNERYPTLYSTLFEAVLEDFAEEFPQALKDYTVDLSAEEKAKFLARIIKSIATKKPDSKVTTTLLKTLLIAGFWSALYNIQAIAKTMAELDLEEKTQAIEDMKQAMSDYPGMSEEEIEQMIDHFSDTDYDEVAEIFVDDLIDRMAEHGYEISREDGRKIIVEILKNPDDLERIISSLEAVVTQLNDYLEQFAAELEAESDYYLE